LKGIILTIVIIGIYFLFFYAIIESKTNEDPDIIANLNPNPNLNVNPNPNSNPKENSKANPKANSKANPKANPNENSNGVTTSKN
jgi:hypothetical protein